MIPNPLKKKYLEIMGEKFVDQLEALSSLPKGRLPLFFRVNTIRCSETQVLEFFEQHHIQVKRQPLVKDSWMVLHGTKLIKTLPEYYIGYYYFQDPTSLLAVQALEIHPFHTLLDACAAPGGKTTYAAQLMNCLGLIVASDVDAARTRALCQNVTRLGASNVIVLNEDAKTFSFTSLGMGDFDRILIDAPCSSDGVVWRNRSWKAILHNYQNLKKITTRQRDLLENCWSQLKQGGILVYSTCSFSLEENEILLTRFLEDHEDARLLNLGNLKIGRPALTDKKDVSDELNKARRFNPVEDSMNGFFLAKLKKIQ